MFATRQILRTAVAVSRNAIVLSSFTFALGAFAQQDQRASIGGKVKDATGAAVRNAQVTVTSDETGVQQLTRTDATGDWIVRFLNPGHYRFDVKANGFKTDLHSSIELQVADQKIIDTTLAVGAAEQTVNVTSDTPLVDPTSSVSGTTITQTELEQLPTQSNAPTMFVGLTPGATTSGGVGGGVFLWSNGGLSGSNVNGTGGFAINYSVDGASDSNNAGNLAFEPPLDAVTEFKVTTNAYDASIGRQSSATINLALKSGEKKFHGDLYEDNQNNFLNSRYYNQKNNPVHYNQFGGSVGGPVWIPKVYDGRARKTFFFFTYAGIHNEQPVNTGFMSVPSALEKTGDFSKSFTTNGGTQYPITIYDPLTYNPATGTRQPFQGNVIPQNRLNPVAVALLNLIPNPDYAHDASGSDSNNFVKQEAQVDRFNGYTLRLDHTWNDRNTSFASLRQNQFNELSYDPYGPNMPYVLLQGLYQARQNRGMTLDHTLTLTPNIVADLRYDILRYVAGSYDPGAGYNPTQLGFPSSFAALQQFPSIPAFTGIVVGSENGGQGTTQAKNFTYDTNQEITGNLTQTAHRHNLHYGYEFLIQQEAVTNLGASGGSFAFGTNWTTQNPDGSNGTGVGSAIASMLLGLPNSGSVPTAATAFWSQHYTGVYVQDDWRVNSKFTLNLGLRWDYERPVTERFNRFFNRYDPNYVNPTVTASAQPGYAADIAGSSANVGTALLQKYGPSTSNFSAKGAVLYSGVNGTSRYVVNPRYKYFQPRVGFAYQFRPDLTFRAGLGRFVQATFYNNASQSGFGASTPFVGTTDNYHTITTTLSNPFPNGLVAPTGSSLGVNTNVGTLASFVDPNIGRPYSDQASAYLDQQIRDWLFELGGTLNITHGQGVTDPLNTPSNPMTGYNVNVPSQAAWLAAFGPQFDANGRPLDTLSGNTQVGNPFLNAPYITNGEQTQKTLTAYQLLRPNPVAGDILYNHANGKQIYYAMNTKIEHRFKSGFSLLQAFTWSKRISENSFIGPQAYAEVIERRLDSGDQRFHYVLTPVYELPFGRGKHFGSHASRLVDELIGGYEISGIYNLLSGTPIVMPTNTSFFEGGDPALSNKTLSHWFDTSRFQYYPTKNTSKAAIAAFPAWTGVTGLPGYNYTPTSASDTARNGVYNDFTTRVTYNQTTFGDVRNPYTNDFTLGLRKSFAITEAVRLQLRMDAFNALNHPRFGNFDTTPSDQYFGYASGSPSLSQVNAPRQIQLSGRLSF